MPEPRAVPVIAGIDVASGSFQLSIPSAGLNVAIPMNEGEWWNELAYHLPQASVVGIEPTGRHYSAPIVNVLHLLRCVVYQVDHQTTKRYRQAHVSLNKDDALDAYSIALLTSDYHANRNVRGVRRLYPQSELLTTALRTLIQAHRRAAKELRRVENRVKQMAYHMWPSLADKFDAYLRAVSVGAVTPAQIVELARNLPTVKKSERPAAYSHGASRNALYRLAATIPDGVTAPPLFQRIIVRELANIQHAQQAIAELDEELEALIHVEELETVTAAWLTVPGAGTLAVATLHAACHASAIQMSGDQLRGALGFYPQNFNSGAVKIANQPMRGYKPARGAIHLWTVQLLKENNQPNPVAEAFHRAKTNGSQYALAAARGRLVRILAGIARSGQPCRWRKSVLE